MNDSKFPAAISLLRAYFSRHEVEERLPDGSSGLALLDPVAGRIVGSHYALSHYCAGLLLLFRKSGAGELVQQADQCLNYIEATHAKYLKEYDYHNDFNNFAWALLLLIDRDDPGFLSDRQKSRMYQLLMNTPDSRHDTVNWLPMRALNNLVRYGHTRRDQFLQKARALLGKVAKAQNPDGMYDDLLPLGQSGNIQYHVYTAAVLQLIRHFKLDDGGGNLESALSFTAEVMDPEGDFNYFGRGANQIFGWGPYFFNLTGIDISPSKYKQSVHFFNDNLPRCLNSNGLLLKNSQQDQNNYWWDYHYTTVYAAHLFFWLNLLDVIPIHRHSIRKVLTTSNLAVTSTEECFCAIYQGRSHYLVERGPQICNVWTRSRGTLFKGPLGPYFDDFGNKHISKAMVVLNYFGLLTEYPAHFIHRLVPSRMARALRRLGLYNKHDADYGLVLKALFPDDLKVDMPDGNTLEIVYRLPPTRDPVSINIPIFPNSCAAGLTDFITAEIDGKEVELFHLGSGYGVYGKFELFRSKPQAGVRNVKVRIALDEIS